MRIVSTTVLILMCGAVAEAAEPVFGLEKTGPAYDDARRKLLHATATTRRLLKARLEAMPAIDAANWRTHARLEIAETLVQRNVNSFERAYALRGIDPATYLKDRRKVPTASAELRALRLPAGVLFELYLETADRYPFAARAAYPPGIDQTAWQRLRDAERSALRQGLLDAIAATRHEVAPFLLADVFTNERADVVERRVAAVSLGATAKVGADRHLANAALDTRLDRSLRTSAIAGLSKHRGPATYGTLLTLATSAKSAPIRATAIAGLGAYATHQARARVGPANADRAALALVELLVVDDGTHEQILVESIARTGSAAALEALKKRDDRSAHRAARRLERTRARL